MTSNDETDSGVSPADEAALRSLFVDLTADAPESRYAPNSPLFTGRRQEQERRNRWRRGVIGVAVAAAAVVGIVVIAPNLIGGTSSTSANSASLPGYTADRAPGAADRPSGGKSVDTGSPSKNVVSGSTASGTTAAGTSAAMSESDTREGSSSASSAGSGPVYGPDSSSTASGPVSGPESSSTGTAAAGCVLPALNTDTLAAVRRVGGALAAGAAERATGPCATATTAGARFASGLVVTVARARPGQCAPTGVAVCQPRSTDTEHTPTYAGTGAVYLFDGGHQVEVAGSAATAEQRLAIARAVLTALG